MSQPSVAQILEALQPIMDPDLGKSIVDLGFVKHVVIEGSSVSFTIELTTPACPVKAEFEREARGRVLALDGIEDVEVESSPHPRLSGIATHAARQWKYSPARKEGIRIKSWITEAVDFKL